MDDKAWETKFKAFLQKTGEDFKRFGHDVKGEAQKLLDEVKDPEGKARIKENLKTATVWARKTAEEVADVVVEGTRKAEEAFMKATERAKDFATRPADGSAPEAEASPAATPPSPPPSGMPEPPPPATPAKKTVGKSAKAKKSGAKKSTRAKKTIGKKKAGEGQSEG